MHKVGATSVVGMMLDEASTVLSRIQEASTNGGDAGGDNSL